MTQDAACKSCGAAILFVRTAKGRLMPLDAEAITTADSRMRLWTLTGEAAPAVAGGWKTGHVSHFATCSEPARFRKVRSGRR